MVVATSNVAPDDLYKDGLNRALFLPFVALMRERLDVVELNARTDFRLEKLARAPVYYCPDDARAEGGARRGVLEPDRRSARRAARTSPLLGRDVRVPQAIDGVARFSLRRSLPPPLGALRISSRSPSGFIPSSSTISPGSARTSATRRERFITLIDALYDMRVKLIASAAAEPAELYSGGDGAEAFEFARAASRLVEMRSIDYLGEPHGGAERSVSGDLGGLVET